MQLCTVEQLKQQESIGFRFELDGKVYEGFAVYHHGEVRAYQNSCPHTGATLNWSPDVFLSPEGTHIQCAIHGALFRPGDGYCEFGPCRGQSLMRLPVRLDAEGGVSLEQGVLLPS